MTESPLKALFSRLCAESSDIHEHLPVLAALGAGERVTEIGFRTGRSACAFLAGGCLSLDSIDIAECEVDPALKGDRFRLHCKDSRVLEPWETDVLFVDGNHSSDGVSSDLRRWAPNARKTVVLHDTCTRKFPWIGSISHSILPALGFALSDNRTNNNGLQVWRRRGLPESRRIRAVTTFSKAGYDCYGRTFLESWARHGNVPLQVYVESQRDLPVLRNVEYVNLDDDPERAAFLATCTEDRKGDPMHPNRQADRFCHKVFAVSNSEHFGTDEWRVWIDADVVLTAPPDWGTCLPPHASVACLFRPQYRYTECGFVAYKIADPAVRNLLADMRSFYTSGEIWQRNPDDRHDSRCFDICLQRSNIPNSNRASLTPQTHTTHVWPNSPLAAWSEHNKGPARKINAYGSVAP